MNCANNNSELIDDELGDFLVTPVKKRETVLQKESETSSQSEVLCLS